MAIKLASIQQRLDTVHPDVTVQGAFLVTDADPAETNTGGDSAGSVIWVIAVLSSAVRMAKAALARLGFDVERVQYFVVVVTDTGTAVGRRSPWRGANSVQEWVHGPPEGLRYTVEPDLPTGGTAVAVDLGGQRYWATGRDRHAAYGLVDQQVATSA